MTMKHSLLPTGPLQKSAFLLETCFHPIGRRIIKLLITQDEMTRQQLFARFCDDFDKVHFQLALLQKADVVKYVSYNRQIHYYLNKPKVAHIKTVLSGFCNDYLLEGAEVEV